MDLKNVGKLSVIASLLIHGVAMILLFFDGSTKVEILNDELEYIDAPEVNAQSTYSAPTSDSPMPKKPTVRAVYGAKKDTNLSSEAAGEVSVKEGNTLNKEVDTLKLRPGEEDLKEVSSAFSVSSLPRRIKEVRAQYPSEARAKGIEGDVVAELIIDKEGKVRSVQIIRSVSSLLDDSARAALMQFQFSPAMKEGAPVAVKIKYTYTFELSQY